ncbi:MAG: hypothetical protein LUD83_10285 [Clostridiales bacterium]|nr:hypothetical protein [Clostridiales bacterium]
MRHEKLLDAIGQVDGDLVQEAEEVKTLAVPHTSGHWRRWAALAAVAVLAVGLFWARAWMDSVAGSDSAMIDAAAEDAATAEAAEEDVAEDEFVEEEEGGISGQASQLWLPLLSVRGSDGQAVTVAGEAVETAAEDALTDAGKEDGTDAASAESAEDAGSVDASAEDTEVLPAVTYDPAQRTLALTLEEDDAASVTAVCTGTDSGEETVLTVTDGVLTLPEGGGGWLVEVTVQWADGRTGLYRFQAEPEGGA